MCDLLYAVSIYCICELLFLIIHYYELEVIYMLFLPWPRKVSLAENNRGRRTLRRETSTEVYQI